MLKISLIKFCNNLVFMAYLCFRGGNLALLLEVTSTLCDDLFILLLAAVISYLIYKAVVVW